MNIKIAGSGSYIPGFKISNEDFKDHTFLDEKGNLLHHSNATIIEKFASITGIEERRYADENLVASDMACIAAQNAITAAGIDAEAIDYIIVAHNFGDVRYGAIQSDILPSLAARVKYQLRVRNQKCVAYDILFGCPGWIEGILQAKAFITSGMAKRCLVIGTETLSRVVDKYDRDSMIYADGAGATVIESAAKGEGLLSYESASYTLEESKYLFFGKSNNSNLDPNNRYLKMQGRKIYEFALNTVPMAMKNCLEKSGYGIDKVKKIIIHQANEKMDQAIVHRFYKFFDQETPDNILPMSIRTLGNSSVATVPTLYDLLMKGAIKGHQLNAGDLVLFASIGAGMNINAFTYRMPNVSNDDIMNI